MNGDFELPPLYPIVNVADDTAAACDRAFALAAGLIEAGATLLQLRAKLLGAGAMTLLASRIMREAHDRGVHLIVNDRVDVAVASGAGGVHLGHEDLPVDAAAAVLDGFRPTWVIGYSTHSVEDVTEARSSRIDYLGFGPVFESPTKAGVREARGLEMLASACRAARLPVVAIGGITFDTAPECWRAGAASVAVISEIERSSDLRSLLAAYRRAWSEAGRC